MSKEQSTKTALLRMEKRMREIIKEEFDQLLERLEQRGVTTVRYSLMPPIGVQDSKKKVAQ